MVSARVYYAKWVKAGLWHSNADRYKQIKHHCDGELSLMRIITNNDHNIDSRIHTQHELLSALSLHPTLSIPIYTLLNTQV